MTDAIIGKLAQLPNFRVISRTSAMFYKNSGKSPQTIGHELDVETLLEGSIITENDQIHINLRLVEISRGQLLWALDYQKPISDLYSFYQESALEVVSRVTQKEMSQVEYSNSLTDQATYQQYLQGLYLWRERRAASLIKAESILLAVTKSDPKFAPAFATLAAVNVQLSNYVIDNKVDRFMLAKQAVDTALKLDINSSAAWSVLGQIEFGKNCNWVAAEKAYKKAIELKPSNSTAKQWYAELLSITGRHNAAQRMIESAWKDDPLNPLMSAVWGSSLIMKGDYQKALEKLTLASQFGGTMVWLHRDLAYVYQWLKEYDNANNERYLEMQDSGYSAELLKDLRSRIDSQGIKGFWQWYLPQLHKKWIQRKTTAALIAEAYAGVDDVENMLKWLDIATKNRGEYILQLLARSPEFHKFRDLPEYKRRLKKLHL